MLFLSSAITANESPSAKYLVRWLQATNSVQTLSEPKMNPYFEMQNTTQSFKLLLTAMVSGKPNAFFEQTIKDKWHTRKV